MRIPRRATEWTNFDSRRKLSPRLITYAVCSIFLSYSLQAQKTSSSESCGRPNAGATEFCTVTHRECDAFTMQTARPLSFGQKSCYWRGQLFTGSAVFGAAFFGGMAMAQGTPKEWSHGLQGFGEQFGTRYAQGMVKSTTTYLFGAMDGEDPRPKPPNIDCKNPHYAYVNRWARLGASLLRVVSTQYTREDGTCGNMPAMSRIVGSVASGFVQLAYLPPSQNKISNAWLGSASALGGYAANSVWSEFEGDLFGFLGKMFPKGKPVAVKPQPSKADQVGAQP